jgi:glyoxylase-like metal-dependent hydrolase (beta-lactamase superfamily II)
MTLGRRAFPALPLAAVAAFSLGARAQTAGPLVRPVNTPGEGAVNTWLLIGPDAVTIVDCQRTVPEAQVLVSAVRGLGRRVEAIVLTHEHPDHAAGLQAVSGAFPGTPIIATAATAQAEYLAAFRGLVRDRLRDGAWTEAARASVVAEAEATWPGWPVVVPIPTLMAQNADAVARELAR